MRIDLSRAQRDTHERFAALFDAELVAEIRRMGESPRRGAVTPEEELADAEAGRLAVWQALVDLGATRLLVPEKFGGTAEGQSGAVVLCELLGAALYQGPLLDTFIAQEILSHTPDTEHERIAETVAGAGVAVAPRASTTDVLHRPGPPLDAEGRLDGVRRFVGAVPQSQYLLAVAGEPGGIRSALVALDDRVAVRRYDEVTRGQLYEVTCTGAPVLSWHTDTAASWAEVVAGARVRHAAYLIGAAQGALDLAVARAGARQQFGKPIGRFQAIAFRLAELATRLSAARWFTYAAAAAHDRRLRAAQALALASDVLGSIVAAAMQIHGAYGLTEDADIQLYYRRAMLDRVWLGTPVDLRREVYPLLAATQDERSDTL